MTKKEGFDQAINEVIHLLDKTIEEYIDIYDESELINLKNIHWKNKAEVLLDFRLTLIQLYKMYASHD